MKDALLVAFGLGLTLALGCTVQPSTVTKNNAVGDEPKDETDEGNGDTQSPADGPTDPGNDDDTTVSIPDP